MMMADHEPIDHTKEAWWFVCTLCQRAYNSHTHLLHHKMVSHNTRGKADTLILSQVDDLAAVVKIGRCSVPVAERQLRQDESCGSTSKSELCKICCTSFQTHAKLKNHVLLVHTPNDADTDPDKNNRDLKPAIVKQECINETEVDDVTIQPDDGDQHDEPDLDPVAVDVDVKEEDFGIRRQRRTRLAKKRYTEESESSDDSDQCSDNSDFTDKKPKHVKHLPPLYNCPLCSATFKHKRDIGSHADMLHQSKEDRTCKSCGRTCSTWRRLLTHIRDSHSRPLNHICPVCGKGFSAPYLLKAHSIHHDKYWTHKCGLCGKMCSSAPNLANHKRSHNERNLMCPQCGKMFKSKPVLEKHQASQHSDQRPHKCSQCEWTFKTRDSFWQHMKGAHSEGRPFVCDKCPMAFKIRSRLKTHIKDKHETRHLCLVCGKEFSGRVSLLRHEVELHNHRRKNTKYECVHCTKVFFNSFGLKTHVAIHGDRDSKFMCAACGKRFSTKASLEQHSVTHLEYEDLKHSCDICGKRFGFVHHVKQHKSSHHRDVDATDKDKEAQPALDNVPQACQNGSGGNNQS